MSINAYIAQGFNPGAGLVEAARIKRGMQQEEEARARNAFVQDRDFNAQQQHRNAMMGRQDKQAAQSHAASIRDAVLKAQTPEQASAIWQMGQQEAMQYGWLSPNDADPNAWQQIYVKPITPNDEWDRRQAAANQEWDRRQNVQAEAETAKATAPPTPKEAADLRKAEAQASEAEAKLEETREKAAAGKATAEELSSMARQLLTPEGKLTEGAAAVFGPVQGGLWSIFGDTIAAEAKIDRLSSLLTLENMDKMKGVLSDNDMKILNSAATILSNKRIPDDVALAEIQRLAGGFEGQSGEGVGQVQIGGAKVTFHGEG